MKKFYMAPIRKTEVDFDGTKHNRSNASVQWVVLLSEF